MSLKSADLQNLFIEGKLSAAEYNAAFGGFPASDLWEERERFWHTKGFNTPTKNRFDVRVPLGDAEHMFSLCKCETFDALSAVLLAVLVKADDGPKRLEIQVF